MSDNQFERLIRFGQRAEQMRDDLDVGFVARELVQATLPHQDPKADTFIRKNGNLALVVRAGVDSNGNSLGLPYGSIPRLLLAFLNTEAVRRKSPHIQLGDSLSDFCRAVGLNPSNGSQLKRLQKQVRRLLSASLQFQRRELTADFEFERFVNVPVARKAELWFFYDKKFRDERSLFGESWVELDAEFYKALVAAPVPLDLSTLNQLKQSPLALDVAMWTTYRCFTTRRELELSWYQLAQQFGSDFTDIRNFARAFRDAVSKVRFVAPYLNVQTIEGGVVLKPSRVGMVPSKPRKRKVLPVPTDPSTS